MQKQPAPQDGPPPVRRFVRRVDAASYLGLSVSALANFAWKGTGPRCKRFGRVVVYELTELDRWADSQGRRGDPAADSLSGSADESAPPHAA